MRLSFRARVLASTLPPAALLLAGLVALVCLRDQRRLTQTLEGALELKWEEVSLFLSQAPGPAELADFLALESSYSSPTSEFYYELRSSDGAFLAGSPNLAGVPLTRAPLLPGFSHLAPPRRAGEEVLALSGSVAGAGPGPEPTHASIALATEPHLSAARAEFTGVLFVAGGAFLVLAAALWFALGQSLRTVSAITREAAAIRTGGLRRRLPENGSGDELDRLTRELNGLLGGLEASFVQMEAFTSDAAHQMRTPLTRIRGEIDLVLAQGGLDPATQESLEHTRAELERLSGTCARLLLLARLDRGALAEELRGGEFDLAALAGELVQELRPLAEEAGVELATTGPAQGRVRGSRALCAEALLNLLDNALRHTPRGGHVRVDVACAGGEVRIDVRDSGPGVPADERELVFHRFHRGRNAVPGGTGLGLSIVRGIARAHGGDALLLAGERGAAFRLCLPAA